MQQIVDSINKITDAQLWFDFEIKFYDGYELIVCGGIDLSNKALIEIKFSDASFCSIKNEWKRKDGVVALQILNGKDAFFTNSLFNIEVGYTLFRFNHEDSLDNFSNSYIIAARGISIKLIDKLSNT